MQRGSLEGGLLYISVSMVHNDVELTGMLLVDIGCNVDLNLSEYKVEQLGLPVEGTLVNVEMGQMVAGQMQRRGVVLVHVQIEDDTGMVSNDQNRSAYLEVWTDIGSKGPATPTLGSATPISSPSPSARPSSSQGK
jgi:hypothetical protein